MKAVIHRLPAATPGTHQELLSLHFGTPGGGQKITIQASLHADEVPGMLVAHHLRERLSLLEDQGLIAGEIVLVPAANPLGLHQWMLRGFQGRFEAAGGENFNRGYADLTQAVLKAVGSQLGADADANVALVRQALRGAVAALPSVTPLDSLRKTLLGLAIDADAVLDLHCDGEAVLHLYTTTASWPQAQTLARCLGARVALLAERSGGDPFDEACSMVWADLAEALGPATPLRQACMAATIELRGEGDVSHALAAADAQGIVDFLIARGVVRSEQPQQMAPLLCVPTPLAGSIPLVAPHGGMLAFHLEPGASVVTGTAIVDVIDPISGVSTTLTAPVDGLFFARDRLRFTRAGMTLGKVAGREARRQGALLSV